MPVTLIQLCQQIFPANTVLVLGAGASIPSGAPSGPELARQLWRNLEGSEAPTTNLTEVTSILVRNHTRRTVIERISESLKKLKPTGGLLALPALNWKRVYTTNFDYLIENAYKINNIDHTVIRSNFDYSSKENSSGVQIIKMHGCCSQDEALGSKLSMVLTEDDYENYKRTKQIIFSSFEGALLTSDVLIVGQSLRDRHLYDLVRDCLLARAQGAPGRVFVLLYEPDSYRTPLLEDQGARVCIGSIDELVHSFVNNRSVDLSHDDSLVDDFLPTSIVSSTINVKDESEKDSNASRMFNGGAASYADIKNLLTFERNAKNSIISELSGEKICATITGAAGVGKTSLARQVQYHFSESGSFCWEHRQDFGFQPASWLKVENQLRAKDKTGYLMIDECTHHMRAINNLVDSLSAIESPRLKLILTANSSQWAPRMKSKNIFQEEL